jgi:hypothetical protein
MKGFTIAAASLFISAGYLMPSADSASVGAPDLSACSTKQASFTFFGKPNKKGADCKDCTFVTYIDGSKGAANCKTYDNWVQSVSSGTNKVIFSGAAGILPGALSNTNPATNWFEIEFIGSSAPLDTIPAGAFDTYADNIYQLVLSSTAPIKISNPAGVFAKKMLKLKTLQMNFPTTGTSQGVSSQLLNANIGMVQTMQLKYGNPTIDADLLNNLPEIRTIVLFNAKATSIPANIFKNNKRINTILLGGEVANGPNMPIKTIPDTIFAGLPKLARVDLKYTNLPAIPATIFAKNPLLNAVNFDSNQFTALPGDIFASNPLLSNVFLFENKLSALPATLFSSVADPSKLRIWLEPQRGTKLTCKSAGAAIPEGAECY